MSGHWAATPRLLPPLHLRQRQTKSGSANNPINPLNRRFLTRKSHYFRFYEQNKVITGILHPNDCIFFKLEFSLNFYVWNKSKFWIIKISCQIQGSVKSRRLPCFLEINGADNSLYNLYDNKKLMKNYVILVSTLV